MASSPRSIDSSSIRSQASSASKYSMASRQLKNRCSSCGKPMQNMDSSTDRPAASNEKKQTVFERLYNNNREKEERRRRLAAEVVGVELRECTYMPVINSAEGGMLSSASYHSISTISHREIKVERIKEKYLQGEICDGCFKGMEIGTGTFYIEDFMANSDLPATSPKNSVLSPTNSVVSSSLPSFNPPTDISFIKPTTPLRTRRIHSNLPRPKICVVDTQMSKNGKNPSDSSVTLPPRCRTPNPNQNGNSRVFTFESPIRPTESTNSSSSVSLTPAATKDSDQTPVIKNGGEKHISREAEACDDASCNSIEEEATGKCMTFDEDAKQILSVETLEAVENEKEDDEEETDAMVLMKAKEEIDSEDRSEEERGEGNGEDERAKDEGEKDEEDDDRAGNEDEKAEDEEGRPVPPCDAGPKSPLSVSTENSLFEAYSSDISLKLIAEVGRADSIISCPSKDTVSTLPQIQEEQLKSESETASAAMMTSKKLLIDAGTDDDDDNDVDEAGADEVDSESDEIEDEDPPSPGVSPSSIAEIETTRIAVSRSFQNAALTAEPTPPQVHREQLKSESGVILETATATTTAPMETSNGVEGEDDDTDVSLTLIAEVGTTGSAVSCASKDIVLTADPTPPQVQGGQPKSRGSSSESAITPQELSVCVDDDDAPSEPEPVVSPLSTWTYDDDSLESSVPSSKPKERVSAEAEADYHDSESICVDAVSVASSIINNIRENKENKIANQVEPFHRRVAKQAETAIVDAHSPTDMASNVSAPMVTQDKCTPSMIGYKDIDEAMRYNNNTNNIAIGNNATTEAIEQSIPVRSRYDVDVAVAFQEYNNPEIMEKEPTSDKKQQMAFAIETDLRSAESTSTDVMCTEGAAKPITAKEKKKALAAKETTTAIAEESTAGAKTAKGTRRAKAIAKAKESKRKHKNTTGARRISVETPINATSETMLVPPTTMSSLPQSPLHDKARSMSLLKTNDEEEEENEGDDDGYFPGDDEVESIESRVIDAAYGTYSRCTSPVKKGVRETCEGTAHDDGNKLAIADISENLHVEEQREELDHCSSHDDNRTLDDQKIVPFSSSSKSLTPVSEQRLALCATSFFSHCCSPQQQQVHAKEVNASGNNNKHQNSDNDELVKQQESWTTCFSNMCGATITSVVE